MNPEWIDDWQKVPAVEIEVNHFEDTDDAICDDAGSRTCNLRAAFAFVGRRLATIKLLTTSVHMLKKGPILIPQFSRATVTSQGTASQKKAVVHHLDVEGFNGYSNAIFIVPMNTTTAFNEVGFKNNIRRVIFGDKGSTVNVVGCSFVNNTFGGEGAAIRVEEGNLNVEASLFFNNTCSTSGAIYTTFSNVSVISSNFLNNTAGSGSAIKTFQSDVSPSLYNTLYIFFLPQKGNHIYFCFLLSCNKFLTTLHTLP